MSLITYFRSSSYNAHDDCEQRYYIEYNLGWRGDSNLKADRGSIVHRVLEVLAISKKNFQDGVPSFDDEVLGKIAFEKLNIDKLVEDVFGDYTAKTQQHAWSEKDLTICKQLVVDAITLNGGMFNPLERTIVQPEMHFDFEIDKPWAKYSYTLPDGNLLNGSLALKGTIDLITDVGDGMYEIIDWKTGRRLNWATGEEKTIEKLQDDPQLRMYHYAAHQLFPDIDHIMITIFFIADGGPFSICYTRDDFPKTEDMIRRKFEYIRATTVPKLNKTWRCKKLCMFGKKTFEGTHIKPIQEFRRGQVTPIGEYMTMCEQIKFEMGKKGMDKVNAQYTKPGHDLGFYKNPGIGE